MIARDCIVSFISVTCLKALFIPLYKSTDFEVHRNWMAITYQKSLKDWYFEDTSPWTLDYPPLFAWFEYLLSHVAKYFDPKMLDVKNLNYSSSQTVFFMRLSVMLSDLVYFWGVHRLYKLSEDRKHKDVGGDPWMRKEVILAMLLLWNPGLLIVDHIHFQYNGFLNGILFMSIADMFQEKYVSSAIWFSLLLNLKHIYLYIAPAYFLFLLKNYCLKKTVSGLELSIWNFMKLSAVCFFTVLFSFGPFVYMGQLNQVLSRLFPVQRGLTHSYWAPNVWALYNFADRILTLAGSRLNLVSIKEMDTCATRGIVQECGHIILPNVSTFVTLLLAVLSILPAAWLIWKKPGNPKVFLCSIILCSFGSFLFGYHVHEKAILMIILPLTFASILSKNAASVFLFLSTVGHFSLFPLLFKEGESVLKITLLLLHSMYSLSSLGQLHKLNKSLLSRTETIYLCGLILLQLFYSFGMKILGLEDTLPFLPLMFISTYCTLGVLHSWIKYLRISLQE